MKKIIFILMMFLFVSISMTAFAQGEPESDIASSVINEEQPAQESAMYYEKLMESFTDKKSSRIIYPDYYGGSYLDDEGNFVIYITGNDVVSSIIQQAIGSDDFIIKPAKYSYNELEHVMNVMNDFKAKNPTSEIANNFNLYYLSDLDNNVVVELSDMSNKQINLFKKNVIDSPTITFVQSTGIIEEQSANNYNKDNSFNLWYLPLYVIILIGAVLFINRTRLIPAMQTNNGNIVAGNATISRKQTIAAVKNSTLSPPKDTFNSIMEKIDKQKK